MVWTRGIVQLPEILVYSWKLSALKKDKLSSILLLSLGWAGQDCYHQLLHTEKESASGKTVNFAVSPHTKCPSKLYNIPYLPSRDMIL